VRARFPENVCETASVDAAGAIRHCCPNGGDGERRPDGANQQRDRLVSHSVEQGPARRQEGA
jgi:hypothetical protein